MSNLTIFNNQQFGEIRVADIDGEPWFVGKDVATALGYSNTKDAIITHVDEEDRRIFQRSDFTTIENHIPKSALPVNFVPADIPNRGVTIINESGVYALVLSSKLPSAKAFKRWVTSEVLPSIRKTGGYQMQAPQMTQLEVLAATAQALVEQERRMNAIEASVSSMDKKLDNVVDVLSAPKTTEAERWQRETHKAITSFCQENSLNYHDCYDGLYEQLEEQAHVSLAIRVKNRKDRAKAQGASAAEMRGITKLFCISIDAKLRIIFDNLVKEFKIAHTLKGGVC